MVEEEELPEEASPDEEEKPEKQEPFPQRMSKAKKIYGAIYRELTNSYTIGNKTIDEWNEEFKIDIPENIDFSTAYTLIGKVSSLYSKALSFQEKSVLLHDLLKRELDSEKARLFPHVKKSKEHMNGSRPPSDDYVKSVIEAEVSEVHDKVVIAEFMMKFWDGKIKSLISIRRALESILFGLSAEIKANIHNDNNL